MKIYSKTFLSCYVFTIKNKDKLQQVVSYIQKLNGRSFRKINSLDIAYMKSSSYFSIAYNNYINIYLFNSRILTSNDIIIPFSEYKYKLKDKSIY